MQRFVSPCYIIARFPTNGQTLYCNLKILLTRSHHSAAQPASDKFLQPTKGHCRYHTFADRDYVSHKSHCKVETTSKQRQVTVKQNDQINPKRTIVVWNEPTSQAFRQNSEVSLQFMFVIVTTS